MDISIVEKVVVISNKSTSLPESDSTKTIFKNHTINFSRKFHLCATDFQQSFELHAFNRTLIIYEAEWKHNGLFEVLFLLIEHVNNSLINIGDLTSHFSSLYTIQCLYKGNLYEGTFQHTNLHPADRTVIIKCIDLGMDQINRTKITIIFNNTFNQTVLKIDINLCWNEMRKKRIGHCLKPLFGDLSPHIIEQWIDYHILIGVEQFYIYDRTTRYETILRKYIDNDRIIYIRFPLPKQIINLEDFQLIDEFVSKRHCLMRTRSVYEWLGTWDFDEYLDFYTNTTNIYLPNCQIGGDICTSMLQDYLETHFRNYSYITLNGINYLRNRNLPINRLLKTNYLFTEEYQYRLGTWNDRDKYFTKPLDTIGIAIHYASLVPGKFYYHKKTISPQRDSLADQKDLIHVHHYPSIVSERDTKFLTLHNGSREYIHDPILWHVVKQLQFIQNNSKINLL